MLSFRFETTKPNTYPPVTYQDIQALRRPSQFIRFDEIKRPSPPGHKEFNNYPILVTQVDSARKDKVFEDDVKRYMAPIGTISPRDRRVLVTDTVREGGVHRDVLVPMTGSSGIYGRSI